MKNFTNKLHLTDARKIGTIIKEPIVDVTITSPPYGDLKDYGFEGQIGYGQDYESEYLEDLKIIFQQCFNITKPTGSLWIIVDTFKKRGEVKLLSFDLAQKLNEVGWRLFDIIIWDKTRTLPWSRKGQLRNTFEYILFFVKSKNFKYFIDRIKEPSELKEWWVKYPERYNPKGKVPHNIWQFNIPTQGSWSNGMIHHFCPFPPKLIERIILLTTEEGDVVLDPFAGSGVVLAQAKCMNRKFIGFELCKEYFERFEKNTVKEVSRLWGKRKEEIYKITEKQKYLEQTIEKLRKVKYPKTLIKKLAEATHLTNFVMSKLNTVFAISRSFDNNKINDKHKFLKEDIYLVFDGKMDFDKLKNSIDIIIRKKPLSKYGIIANFFLNTIDNFIEIFEKENLFDPKKLWVYARGLTNLHEGSIAFDEWKENCIKEEWHSYFKNGIPPIISNIQVHQRVIRT